MSNEAAQDELQQAINNITNGTMSSSDESSDALAEIESRLGGSAKGGKSSKGAKVDVSTNADATVSDATASDTDAAAKAASEAAAAAASATDIPTLPMVDATPAAPTVDASSVGAATLGVPALGATVPIPAPEAPAMPAMPDFMTAPAASPVANTAVASGVSVASTASVLNDPALNAVRSKALSDLRPLIDKIDVPAEKQYQLYKDILEATNDKSLVEPLYTAIGNIADEKARAEALLYLIEKINTLG